MMRDIGSLPIPFTKPCRNEEEMRLSIGERLIPHGALRKRLNEIPEDKGKEIICFCRISLRVRVVL